MREVEIGHERKPAKTISNQNRSRSRCLQILKLSDICFKVTVINIQEDKIRNLEL
jgi:hypothetical protein